ncbi:Protein/nucleic acid deglycase 1 [BD1-7 clade bacterium]|uniref:Protein/nucleic acid deglycase 1 n=1 Tax=BD1-7 clade bacterium TaxID=2029982 RepID=A0A5S9PL56_9GAMM|nr:Protein/nucleic acid deglycase 1 [BD1-7 clade bacterium]
MNILFVLTSHDQLGNTGEKTGFWIEEFAAPYYVLADNGATITLASPKGGQPPIDPKSELADFQTSATQRFDDDKALQEKLANTQRLDQVSADAFDAVFYPGGHGPLWDLTDNADSIRLIESFIAQNKIVSAVCHAPTVLLRVKDQQGNPWVNGKKVTAFSNSEEAAVGLTDVVPELLEDALAALGASYSKTDDWHAYCVEDGQLITGQNPASSEAVANAVLQRIQ